MQDSLKTICIVCFPLDRRPLPEDFNKCYFPQQGDRWPRDRGDREALRAFSSARDGCIELGKDAFCGQKETVSNIKYRLSIRQTLTFLNWKLKHIFLN